MPLTDNIADERDAEIVRLRAQVSDLKADGSEAADEITELTLSLSDRDAEITRLRRRIEELGQVIDEKNIKLDDLIEERNANYSTFERHKARVAELEAELARARADVEDWRPMPAIISRRNGTWLAISLASMPY